MGFDEARIDDLVLEAVVDLEGIFVEPRLEIVEGHADRQDLSVCDGDRRASGPREDKRELNRSFKGGSTSLA